VIDHFGCAPVLFAERQIKRRQLVAEATRAAPVELDAQGVAAALGGRALRFAVEATGSPAVLDRLLGVVAGGARIAMVGIFHGKSEINANAVVEREIELRGCSVFADEQAEAVRLLPTLAPRLAQLLSVPIGLEAVPAAYQDLIEGRAPALKTIIRP